MRYVESLNRSLHQLMADDDRVFVIGEDILDPYGGAFKVTKGLSTAYPDRVITTPISEAGITGFAVGMSMRGLRPVLEIMFGDFITLCADQIVNSACKFSWMYNEQVTVPVVIRTPMGGRRGYGPTHSQTLETLFLNVPRLTMVAPSHFHNPGQLLIAAIRSGKDPTLFIENKSLYPKLLKEPNDRGKIDDFFVSLRSNLSSDYPTTILSMDKGVSPDVTLVAYGGMAPLAAEAAFNAFMRDEIVVEVVIPSIIKPIPLDDILPSVNRSRGVVVVEEAARTSGWGAELSCQITEKAFGNLAKPVERVGAREVCIPSSRPMEDQVLPQVEDIENSILTVA